jgi:FixJ family two-component response regulator
VWLSGGAPLARVLLPLYLHQDHGVPGKSTLPGPLLFHPSFEMCFMSVGIFFDRSSDRLPSGTPFTQDALGRPALSRDPHPGTGFSPPATHEKLVVIAADWDQQDPLAQTLSSAHIICPFDDVCDFFAHHPADDACCILLKTVNTDPTPDIARFRAAGLTAPVIVLAEEATASLAVASLKGGAFGFHWPPYAVPAIVADVLLAIRASAATRRRQKARFQAVNRLQMLTSRERQVAQHLVAGLCNKEIASQLGISERTVEHHRASVNMRLRISHLAGLVRLAMTAEPLDELPTSTSESGAATPPESLPCNPK